MIRRWECWWQKRLALALAMVAATLPLWFVRLPPLIDLLGHMGRYHVEASLANNPDLAANWNYRWHPIGNLGCDLIMAAVMPLFGLEHSALIISGLILVVMMSGMARLSRAVHGQMSPTVWAAFLLSMSYPWHYGLVNYWLAVGLSLHAAAFVWPMRDDWRRALLLMVLSLGLWIAHIYGWAIFATLLFSQALAQSPVREGPDRCIRLFPLAVPMLVMIALRYGRQGQSAQTLGWFEWDYKLASLAWTFRDQVRLLDFITLLAALLLIAAGCLSRRLRMDRSLSISALILLVSVIFLPYQLFGSAYADGRLWPVTLTIALLAIRTGDGEYRLGLEIATAALLLFMIRIAFTASGFLTYDASFARHLAAIERVPRGSRIAVFVDFPCRKKVAWRRSRLEHLDGIAIVRRDVFTNGQWDVPGAELLLPLAAKGSAYNSDPSQLVRSCGNAVQAVSKQVAQFPRNLFDYVWLIDYQPTTLPTYTGLSPLFADERTILYRIEHGTVSLDRRTLLQRSAMPARIASPPQ